MTSMKTVDLVIIITVRVEVVGVPEISEVLQGLQPRVVSEAEVLTQIPSVGARLHRDPQEITGEDNPVLTGKTTL